MEETIELFENESGSDSDIQDKWNNDTSAVKNIRNKIPLVDKHRPKKLDEIVQQDEVIRIMKECLVTGRTPHMLLWGPSGIGKCLAPDTPVRLFNGEICEAQNVKTDDKLMGDDGTARNVLSVCEGYDEMYTVKQSIGDNYTVNSYHVLSLTLSSTFVCNDGNGTYELSWFRNHEENTQQFSSLQQLLFFKKSLQDINQAGDICDIPLNEYLERSELWRSVYRGFKADGSTYNIAIKSAGYGRYCGFELDGNGRFVLADGTITHNTSSVLAFAMELFGPKIFDQRVIELNASDERGISVVRNKIINFAKTKIGNSDPCYPCPPYKIIILDEADAMTVEAQSALRTVMESLSNVTRFCFICNYVNQMIDPIVSRCMKFRFKPITVTTMTNKLREIAEKEDFPIPGDILDKIVELAKGDIRNGIITLQYIKYIYDYQGCITLADIYETTNYLPISVVHNIWTGHITNPKATIIDIRKQALLLKQKGYSVNTVLEKINQIVVRCPDLSNTQKSSIAFALATTEKRLIDGADEYIQLFNILAHIQGVYRGIKI